MFVCLSFLGLYGLAKPKEGNRKTRSFVLVLLFSLGCIELGYENGASELQRELSYCSVWLPQFLKTVYQSKFLKVTQTQYLLCH